MAQRRPTAIPKPTAAEKKTEKKTEEKKGMLVESQIKQIEKQH